MGLLKARESRQLEEVHAVFVLHWDELPNNDFINGQAKPEAGMKEAKRMGGSCENIPSEQKQPCFSPSVLFTGTLFKTLRRAGSFQKCILLCEHFINQGSILKWPSLLARGNWGPLNNCYWNNRLKNETQALMINWLYWKFPFVQPFWTIWRVNVANSGREPLWM